MSSFNIVKRQLGQNGPILPAIGLGCMGMSPGFYGNKATLANVSPKDILIDEDNADITSALATLTRAVEDGCILWDTANLYGFGHNEKLISHVLKKHRDQVFICTKFGFHDFSGTKFTICAEPSYIRQCCEESLARLGVDCIDLYYQHRVDPNVPIETSVGAMAELVREGKVKYIGLSECSAETLRRAHKVHPIAAVQVEYSPWTRDIETNGLLDACKELNIALVAYAPLGRGFLTGKVRTVDDIPPGDRRHYIPRFEKEAIEKNLALVDAFRRIGEKKGCTAGQLCLAWVLKQWNGIFVIPGTKRVKYLEENLGANNVVITDEDDKELRGCIEGINVVGDRYDADGMSALNL
ncbi:aldo/keto reductase [Syncephalis fuscata]|nr:aldo/keto reductase [Syncephalis fuscata]